MRDTVSSGQSGVKLQRDEFFADIIGNLIGQIEDLIGLEEAAGFISSVGDEIGADISRTYLEASGVPEDPAAHVARVCCDLKAQIDGKFEAVEIGTDRVVFEASRCPFAQRVEGHPALCMMTTNVFGRVAADANGYARVHIAESIATGHGRCRVCVDLVPNENGEGYEFYR